MVVLGFHPGLRANSKRIVIPANAGMTSKGTRKAASNGKPAEELAPRPHIPHNSPTIRHPGNPWTQGCTPLPAHDEQGAS
jgi:hypothetical protein